MLLTHPKIADAAVVPSPDERAGEVPKAFVVAKPNAGPLTEQEGTHSPSVMLTWH